MLRRLKIKFICINMFIVTSMLAVIFGMVLTFTNQNMALQREQTMQKLHQMQFHKVPMEWDIRVPYFMVQINNQGTLSVNSANFFSNTEHEQLVDIAAIARNREYTSGVLKEYDLQYSREVTPFGERIVFIDISRDRVIMNDLLKSCGIIGFLSLSVFFVISLGFAQWAVKPVDQAWKQQKQFVADASHELKTPLTVILTNAELLSSQHEEAARNQFIQNIQTMSLQMRGLVESLLDLARLDNGTAQMGFSDLDFSRLTEDSLLPFEPLYFEQGLALEGRVEEKLMVRGSESHLRQVLDILLDNALKYSVPDCTVSVTLQRHGMHCLLGVSGSGAEISREDLKNIFKRFYRIDKVRTMNRSYGLGLPIAQSIVQEHNGKIWAESQNGINTFYVQLPLAR